MKRLKVFVAVSVLWHLTSCQNLNARSEAEDALRVMKDIRAAESTFRSTGGAGRYGSLSELAGAKLIADSLADGEGNGYRFEVTAGGDSYRAIAAPLERDDAYGYVGWSYYLDQSGVIRGRAYGRENSYGRASEEDRPVADQ